MAEQWLVVDWGRIRFYGPFDSEKRANEYIDENFKDMCETIEMTINKFE